MTGNNVISLTPVGKALVVFNIVGLKRGVMDYYNNFFIARELSWIIARQQAGEAGGTLPNRRRQQQEPEQERAEAPVEMGEVRCGQGFGGGFCLPWSPFPFPAP